MKLPALEKLDLSGNPICDLSPFEGMDFCTLELTVAPCPTAPPSQFTDANNDKSAAYKKHDIVFSEVMFYTLGALPQWIEVYNNSDAAINLRGARK